jgi:DNA-binding transcriptional MerR regulator
MPAELSSGDLSRATGCTVRAIRFYEEQGLLAPSLLSRGRHRRYGAAHLERLHLIADLRELGLPLQEIRRVLELRAGCTSSAEFTGRFRDLLRSQVEHARRRLDRLRRLKRELEAALATIEARLGPRCPCEVVEGEGSPRIVRLIASGGLCSHGSSAGGETAWEPPGDRASDGVKLT